MIFQKYKSNNNIKTKKKIICLFIKKKIVRYFTFNFLLYILGRFKTVRYFYKFINLRKNSSFEIEKNSNKYLDTNLNHYLIIKNLETNGFYDGLKLNETTLKDIITLSNQSDLITTIDKKKFKNFDEINNYNLNNKNPYCLVNVVNPELKNLMEKISRNSDLLGIAENYLGKVNKIDVKTQWSPLCKATDNWRKINEQTVSFHYDVHHLNFLYIFFYITDCDKDSGAHELINGSHNKKKFFKHLIGSAIKSQKSLEKYYDKKDFTIIEGQAGHGFVEDTSCFHRARPPIKNSRLALQFRYY
jgi:hypothetical protein